MMKKITFLMLTLVAAVGLASCNNSCDNSKCAKSNGQNGDKEVLYSGILPAADAQATVYTLKLDFDDDHNCTEGDFTMVENTLAADTAAVSGLKEAATAYTKGDFRKESKQVDGADVNYIRLIPDAKDALGTASAASLYFIINADESLTMVGEDLQKAANAEMNYTLSVVNKILKCYKHYDCVAQIIG